MVSEVRPWLWLPAALAHQLSPWALKLYGLTHSQTKLVWRQRTWRGLDFSNPLGLAGGVDKDGDQILDWWTLGPGFLEVGTITPKPQGPNGGSILKRSASQEALWNRMGFPSKGAAYVREQLEKLPQRLTPIFANLGKNRETPNDRAVQDYVSVMRDLGPSVDGFVVNLSSPNTQGLRDLLKPQNLHPFLDQLIREKSQLALSQPLFVKLSPDMLESEFREVLDLTAAAQIDGWVLTNTSIEIREGLSFPREGGVSGRPLAARSKKLLKLALDHLGSQKKDRLIISVGGVMSAEDVFDRLAMGADLVQIYSALVFRGPQFFKNVARESARLQ